MLSAMFRRDFAAFRSQGLDPAPEDVVRLNALAVRVRLAASAPRTAHLPRLAFLPRDARWRAPIVLREPTVAHELWLEHAARIIDCDDPRNWLLVNAFALARPADALPDAFAPRKVVRAVFRFAAKRLVRFTSEQLYAAVEYCLFGADWTAGEAGGERRRGGDDDPVRHLADVESSPTLGLLAEARALRLPLSIDDAKRLTASELAESVRAAQLREGLVCRDDLKADALADYVRAREEIRARLKAEAKDKAKAVASASTPAAGDPAKEPGR